MHFFLLIELTSCRNLPYDGSVGEKLKERLSKRKTRESRHQRLFEENTRKTKKRYADFENKGSGVVYVGSSGLRIIKKGGLN